MSDLDDIRAVLAAYCRLCDDGRFDEFAELFTPDAEFTALDSTHLGRDAIKTWMASVQPPEQRGKHMISEPAITFDSNGGNAVDGKGDDTPTSASGRTDYVFIGRTRDGGLQVTSAGRYVDRYQKADDGRWYIAARRIVFLGDPE